MHVGVVEGEHPAAGVLDDDHLFGPEELLTDHERTDRVVGREPARVPDDVGITGAQREHVLHRQPCIHAREHGELSPGRERKGGAIELVRVALVLGQGSLVFGRGCLDRHGVLRRSRLLVDGGVAGSNRALALRAQRPRRTEVHAQSGSETRPGHMQRQACVITT